MSKNKGGDKVKIASLDEFKEQFNQRFTFDFSYNGKQMSIEYEQISPKLQLELDKIFNRSAGADVLASCEVFPPRKTDPKTGAESYDFEDVEYKKALLGKAEIVQALALYHAVPIFREGKPGLTDRNEIVEYIQSQGNQSILQGLWLRILYGTGINLSELADFTSGRGLEN